MPRLGPSLAALALLALLLGGCAPQSRYRHSAAVPAARPLAWDGRTARKGSLRLEGTYHHTSVTPNLAPQLHDTAAHVPRATIDGVAAVAVSGGLEVGLRGSYASYAWTGESAVGTQPLLNEPPVVGAGPEVRGTIWFGQDKRVGLGIGGNLMSYRLGTSRWQRDPGCIDNGGNCYAGYRRIAEKTETFWVTNVALYPSFNVFDHGFVFGGLSIHDTFRNDGFTNDVTPATGTTLEADGYLTFAGGGFGYAAHGLRASAMASFPLSSSTAIQYAWGAFVTLGGELRFGSD